MRAKKRLVKFAGAVAFLTVPGILLHAQPPREFQDPISKLSRQLAAGSATLEFDTRNGYLTSLLKRLDIQTDSQILVFSKTSFQQQLISPQKPRALYYNDEAIVSFVQDAPFFEFVALDPTNGLQFFTMEQRETAKPQFKTERGSCTFCHGPINKWAQGVMVATVFPAPDGKAYHPPGELFHLTDHRSPFEDRWGGYWVTGTHGSIQHRGNAFAPDPAHPDQLDRSHSSNLTSLKDRFDVSKYLESSSDIVALMTLEHQTMMTNILTSVAAQFRASETLPLPEVELDAAVDRVVSFMLFVDETKLVSPIKGVSTFTETFPKRGPRDSQGRSLRDFDLQTRMFKYPLSYMIYSSAFDGMPNAARTRIYRRLYDVLTGKLISGGYAQLNPERRRAILEILIETKRDLPAYFKP
jgi:hypothetical protein